MSRGRERDVVLISSLGRSPPVVTETVDALIERGLRPRRVYVLTTSDSIVQEKCIPLIREEFKINYPDVELVVRSISRDDIYDEQDNEEFMLLVAEVLDREVCRGSYISMCLAGGRKTMSAAMAILGWIYGADEIIHVLVPPEIEKKGHVEALLSLDPEERAKVLHPPNKRIIIFRMYYPIPTELTALQPQELIKRVASLAGR